MLFSVVKGRGLLLLGGLFSLALHGLIWLFLQSEEVNAQTQMAPSYAPMRVSVSISAPAVPQESLPQKAKSKPQLKPQPQAQISKPIVPKKAKIEQAKIVKAAKATEPKQIAKPLLKPVEKTLEVEEEAVKKASPKPSITTPVQASITKPLKAESKTVMPLLNKTEQKNQLIAELMRRIDQNKHYPKRALKRGIEGRVRFTLVLDRAGQLQSFEWLEGNRLFYKSTLEAIKRSLPLKLSTDQQPLNHQLALQYTIRN